MNAHVLVIDRRPEARGIDMIEGESDGDPIENPRKPGAVIAGDEGRIVLFLKGLDRFDIKCADWIKCAGWVLGHRNPPLGSRHDGHPMPPRVMDLRSRDAKT